jgi:surface antigen
MTFRLAPSLLFAACLALAPAAGAQGLRWLRDERGLSFTAEDMELQRQAMREALDDKPDGESVSWRNEATGHSGRVTPVTSFEEEGKRCRAFRLDFATTRTGRLDLRACRQPDGSWKTY